MSNFALYSKVLFRPGLLFWLSSASQPVKLGKLLIQTPGGYNRTKTLNKDQRKRKKVLSTFSQLEKHGMRSMIGNFVE